MIAVKQGRGNSLVGIAFGIAFVLFPIGMMLMLSRQGNLSAGTILFLAGFMLIGLTMAIVGIWNTLRKKPPGCGGLRG